MLQKLYIFRHHIKKLQEEKRLSALYVCPRKKKIISQKTPEHSFPHASFTNVLRISITNSVPCRLTGTTVVELDQPASTLWGLELRSTSPKAHGPGEEGRHVNKANIMFRRTKRMLRKGCLVIPL